MPVNKRRASVCLSVCLSVCVRVGRPWSAVSLTDDRRPHPVVMATTSAAAGAGRVAYNYITQSMNAACRLLCLFSFFYVAPTLSIVVFCRPQTKQVIAGQL